MDFDELKSIWEYKPEIMKSVQEVIYRYRK